MGPKKQWARRDVRGGPIRFGGRQAAASTERWLYGAAAWQASTAVS